MRVPSHAVRIGQPSARRRPGWGARTAHGGAAPLSSHAIQFVTHAQLLISGGERDGEEWGRAGGWRRWRVRICTWFFVSRGV